MSAQSVRRDLAALVGDDAVLDPAEHPLYLHDATAYRGVRGAADAVVLPATADEVADVMRWCYERGIPTVPRGGGTGLAGGCVPAQGSIVVATDRLAKVRRFEPETWFMHVEAGVRTATVQRRARENGLLFAPDPGASEQSHIGGNIATNAGGPHAFKYGVTGRWVTGLEVVLAPGERATFGGPFSKDVAGYALAQLFVGSEGTLGTITAAWLRLVPAPEEAFPVIAFHGDPEAGCAAVEHVIGAGLDVAALEFLDAATLALSRDACPLAVPDAARFAVVVEADGTAAEAAHRREEAAQALSEDALAVHALEGRAPVADFWRWRDGISTAVAAARGGKVSEDVAVPPGRLCDMVAATIEIGRQHGLQACSWGHAGDGNVHAAFLVDERDAAELERAEEAAAEIFEVAIGFGGTISGEHGTGLLKRGFLERQWGPASVRAHRAVKAALDPSDLLNPGKKQ